MCACSTMLGQIYWPLKRLVWFDLIWLKTVKDLPSVETGDGMWEVHALVSSGKDWLTDYWLRPPERFLLPTASYFLSAAAHPNMLTHSFVQKHTTKHPGLGSRWVFLNYSVRVWFENLGLAWDFTLKYKFSNETYLDLTSSWPGFDFMHHLIPVL